MLGKFVNGFQGFFDTTINVRFSGVSVESKNVGNGIFFLNEVPAGSKIGSEFITA
jgi:hypothetical protein